MDDDGIPVSTPEGKAELFAKFFASQCSSQEVRSDVESPGAPYPLSEGFPEFELQPISELTVFRRLKRLSPTKSSGCPLLSNRVLRETAPIITQSLTYIYNLSLQTHTFPKEWKQATVIPLYKRRGAQDNPANYRPVSLLPAAGKVLDDIQSKSLSSFLLQNNLLTDHQFGFLPSRSTTHQLVYVVHQWLKAFDNRQTGAAVFLDFHKAFDKVWHKGLLFKLASCGVTTGALEWFRSYLSERSVAVRVGSGVSLPHSITAGVPQGSHLGPILFTVFINDLPTSIQGSQSDLYADDALIHNSFSKQTIPQDLNNLQASIEMAFDWASKWEGTFSSLKTKILPLSKETSTALQSNPVQVRNQSITVVESHKHLGIFLSMDLQWNSHIQQMLRKGKQRAGLLRHMSCDLPEQICSKLYTTYVRPIFEYACPVWHHGITLEQALALERIQASIARSILKANWLTPKAQLLERMQWPSLRWRRAVLTLTFFHRLLSNPPGPLKECLFPFASTTGRSLRKPRQLILGPISSSRLLKSFFYRTAIQWNSLPANIQNITCTSAFKHALEHHWQEYQFNASKDPC